ncbi:MULTISPECIES: hypothetical protein [Arthrobacter]|uniref:hypothetical protein n=1 Tax=unclassified Arthrobacter TaxID=235627 RepID=UPI0024BB060D|nr:hypothetical protein [Arthrobacter sp. H35-MC1]MDJ0318825.1 hypothetical protein [Arthrobacter sp. H35-MC1]
MFAFSFDPRCQGEWGSWLPLRNGARLPGINKSAIDPHSRYGRSANKHQQDSAEIYKKKIVLSTSTKSKQGESATETAFFSYGLDYDDTQ